MMQEFDALVPNNLGAEKERIGGVDRFHVRRLEHFCSLAFDMFATTAVIPRLQCSAMKLEIYLENYYGIFYLKRQDQERDEPVKQNYVGSRRQSYGRTCGAAHMRNCKSRSNLRNT